MTSADKIAEAVWWHTEVRNKLTDLVVSCSSHLGERSEAVRLMVIMDSFPDMTTENHIMVLIQRPKATDLRPWHEWGSLGRRVRRGEKGVRLLVGDAEDPPRKWGTRVVFDVSQTDPDRSGGGYPHDPPPDL